MTTFDENINIYDSYRESSLIPTSYLRDYGNTNMLIESPLPYQNYTPYDLFVMRSRLEPYLTNILSDIVGWYTKFITLPTPEGMRVHLHVLDYDSDRGANLNFEQKNKIIDAINDIGLFFKSYCLVFDPDTVDLNTCRYVSRSWMRTIIPYLKIKSEFMYDYNSSTLNIANETIPIVRHGYRIFADFSNSPRHIEHWSQLQHDILTRLCHMYNIGAVIIDTSICLHNIIIDWKLKPLYNNVPEYESLDDESNPIASNHVKGVYVPDWYDTRLTPMSEFMNRIMFGDKTLKISVEEKLTAYHSIAKRLTVKNIEFSFARGMVIANINNQKQAVECLNDICNAMSNQPDTVMQLDPSESLNNDMLEKAHRLGFNDTVIYYLSPFGHYLSIGLSINNDQSEVYRLLREE